MSNIDRAVQREEVLAFLATGSAEYGVFDFATIMKYTKLSRSDVRRACRLLRRQGLAEFHFGCWTEDGEPAGSGYSATKDGHEAANAKKREEYAVQRWD